MGGKITILGPGLLGASLGKAVRERRLFESIHAWSQSAETREKCRAQPWCDAVHDTPSDAIAGADMVVLCPPVKVIPALLEKLSGHLAPGTVVTDVGSTKASICEAAAQYLPDGVRFVGSHPMAGSEKTGLENARPDLFEDQACILTPTEETGTETTKNVRQFWEQLGMRVGEAPPAEHDRIVAAVSHLPHILASILCENLAKKDPAWKAFAGKGLRDTTRVAAGDPYLWRQIIEDNSMAIAEMLTALGDALGQFSQALERDDFQRVEEILGDGKIFRDSL